jgi:hypothetical protein
MEVLHKVSDVAGHGLGAVFHSAGRLRRGPKALHPRGRVGSGRLTIQPEASPLGSPLLDQPGEHACTVRLSRATGVPHPLPDILGLALRVEQGDDGPADLLFASTGLGAVGRHLLVPRRDHDDGALTTLLPLRSRRGAVLLALVPTTPGCYDLRTSAPGRRWEDRGVLVVDDLRPDDRSLRFDPVERTPSGLEQYDVVRRLRAPSYDASPDPR